MQGDQRAVDLVGNVVRSWDLECIDAVGESLEVVHRRRRIVQVRIAAELPPIGRLSILDHVEAGNVEKGKQRPEAGDHVVIDVAAIVDHDIERADFAIGIEQEGGIGLVPLEDAYPRFLERALVVEVDTVDAGIRKVGFPHPERGASES